MTMKKEGRVVISFAPDAGSSRHSEGAFLRLKDGRILFVYSRFTQSWADDAPSDLVAVTSPDEGETWSEARVVIPAAMYGVNNVMSVSLMRMRNGDVGLFYIVKAASAVSKIMLSRSSDEGETFSRHIECTLPDRRGYYVLNNDRVERLASGRIIAPLTFHRGGYDSSSTDYMDGRGEACFLYSDDDGETWREAADVVFAPFTGTASGLQENGVVEKKNGVLWGYSRTDRMYQYEYFSMDAGEHWTIAGPSRFTSPCSPMKIRRNPETGFLYAVWNPVPVYNGRYTSRAGWGRVPLVYAVSRDDGVTWSEERLLEDDPEHGYCYPAIHFTRDHSMLIGYCAGGPEDRACLARLSIRKVPLRDDE